MLLIKPKAPAKGDKPLAALCTPKGILVCQRCCSRSKRLKPDLQETGNGLQQLVPHSRPFSVADALYA